MKVALLALALALSAPSSNGWETEVRLTDEWEHWADRMILQFRLPEWDAPPPVLKPIMDA